MKQTRKINRSAIADKLKVSKAAVSQWFSKQFPVDRCPDIERVLNGQMHCEQMRPDVRWIRVPDPEWVAHAGGRPLADLASTRARRRAAARKS